MAQDIKKTIKPMAIKLRKSGLSYSEIQKEIYVPKSTLSLWLKNLKLTEAQLRRLKEKRIKAAKIGTEKKIANILRRIKEAQELSARDVKQISDRELWLMGIMLYWKERLARSNKNDIRKGVSFTSSDPNLVRFFLRWLRKIGRLKKEEIAFDIFIGKEQQNGSRKSVIYWSKITGFSMTNFSRIYSLKSIRPTFGLLRIRVRASSMLARQIAGWVGGIKKVLYI